MMHLIFSLPIAIVIVILVFPLLSKTSMGLPRLAGIAADYSAPSLAHKSFDVTLDEDDFAAEFDANGTLRLGKRDGKGKVRQVIPGGWSWIRQGTSADAGVCLGGHNTSDGTHCYTLSISSGELLRPDGTRFGRIVYVFEPEIAPRVSQEVRDITGQ